MSKFTRLEDVLNWAHIVLHSDINIVTDDESRVALAANEAFLLGEGRTPFSNCDRPEGGIELAPSRKNRLYLAGPMTGLPDLNFPAFNAAAAALRERGYHVENPAEHGIVEGAEWGDYLRYDIGRLVTCEGIALLPGWFQSKGARLEANIAKELGMEITLLDGAEGYTSSFEDRKKRRRLWAEYPEIMRRHLLRRDQMLAARHHSDMRAQLAAGDVVESDLPTPHDAAEEREAILDKIRTPGRFPSLDELMRLAAPDLVVALEKGETLEEAAARFQAMKVDAAVKLADEIVSETIKATDGHVTLEPLGKKTVEVIPPWRAYLLGALGILRSGWDTGNVDEAVAQCIDHLNACLGEGADHG